MKIGPGVGLAGTSPMCGLSSTVSGTAVEEKDGLLSILMPRISVYSERINSHDGTMRVFLLLWLSLCLNSCASVVRLNCIFIASLVVPSVN